MGSLPRVGYNSENLVVVPFGGFQLMKYAATTPSKQERTGGEAVGHVRPPRRRRGKGAHIFAASGGAVRGIRCHGGFLATAAAESGTELRGRRAAAATAGPGNSFKGDDTGTTGIPRNAPVGQFDDASATRHHHHHIQSKALLFVWRQSRVRFHSFKGLWPHHVDKCVDHGHRFATQVERSGCSTNILHQPASNDRGGGNAATPP